MDENQSNLSEKLLVSSEGGNLNDQQQPPLVFPERSELSIDHSVTAFSLDDSSRQQQQPQQGQFYTQTVSDGNGAAYINAGYGNGGNGTGNGNRDAIEDRGGQIIIDALQPGHGLRGEEQPDRYRDAPYAVVFIIHLLIMMIFAFFWGLPRLVQAAFSPASKDYAHPGWSDDNFSQNNENDNQKPYYPPESKAGSSADLTSYVATPLFFNLVAVSSIIGMFIASASLSVLSRHAEHLIQMSLISSCTILAVATVGLFGSGYEVLGILSFVSLCATILYAYFAWGRIVFCVANLTVALEAITANSGILYIAYGMGLVSNMWVLLWALASAGISMHEAVCDENNSCRTHLNFITVVLLLFSYYWTSQTLKNILEVTIAGVVGTFWFAPQDANARFSTAVSDSFRRATTYSLGSICMGSLLVAVLDVLEQLTKYARQMRNRVPGGDIALCIIECLIHFLQLISEYFNRWAMQYIGLYGYDFVTAGRRVTMLFAQRGWSAIINDQLLSRALTLISFVVGLIIGVASMLFAKMFAPSNHNGEPMLMLFVGFVIGWSLSSTIMSVVYSAVGTVIVCFAESPQDLQINHPRLSEQMEMAWRIVYPDEFCS